MAAQKPTVPWSPDGLWLILKEEILKEGVLMVRPIFSLGFLVCLGAFAQAPGPLSCVVTSVPALVRGEGVSERLGDVVLNCSGGVPGAQVRADLHTFLSVPLTNRLRGDLVDAVLTVDTGSGPQSTGATPEWMGLGSLVFRGMNFQLPASGAATLRVSNLRGAASAAGGQPVRVQFAANGPSPIRTDNNSVVVGTTLTGLLAGYSTTFVCRASPIPAVLAFSSLIGTGTRYASARFTEGFASAFQKKGPADDNGTRVVVRYSGFPKAARLFVPDVIAGSTALEQTAGADLGLPVSGGAYQAGTTGGALLLIRIRGHDTNGAGGVLSRPVPQPAEGPVIFDSVSELELTAGSGMVVYEVVDSNSSVRESAQFPTFLGLPHQELPVTETGSVRLSFGPVSQETAATTGPVPRFLTPAPPADCDALRDCTTNFPKMRVEAEPLVFNVLSGGGHQIKYIFIYNDGGGVLDWAATVTYKNGKDWVRLDPPSGRGGMRLDVLPLGLAPGLYEATLTIDAGPIAGTKSLPISMRVGLPPSPVTPSPVTPSPLVERVLNGASLVQGPVAPGSLAVIAGSRFSGETLSVTIENIAAKVLARNETQIRVEVPSTISGQAAQLIVTVDGRRSPAVSFPLTPIAPAVFAGGVLNEDNTPNDEAHPAMTGSLLQILATGLPLSGVITAKIHDREITVPDYAGPSAYSPAVQQINFAIPADLPSMMTEVLVCGATGAAPGDRVCAQPALVWLRRPE
jgi:uncharacterized protein (TIGR03437 family)